MSTRKRLARLLGGTLAIVAVLAVASALHAGPPMISDDPGLPKAGTWEINTPYTLNATRSETRMQAPLIDANYSVTDHFQLTYQIGLFLDQAPGTGMDATADNSLFGFKWRFADQDKLGVDLSIAPSFELNFPTRSVRRGVLEDHSILTLPLEIGHDFGRFEVYSDMGYQFVQHSQDYLFFGVVGGYHVNKQFELLAEIYTNVDAAFREPEPIADVGFSWALSDAFGLLFSVGRGLRDTRNSPQVLLYAGMQFHF